MTFHRASMSSCLIALLTLASSCGGGGAKDAAGPQPEPTDTERDGAASVGDQTPAPLLAPNPRTVAISLDTAHATTATIAVRTFMTVKGG